MPRLGPRSDASGGLRSTDHNKLNPHSSFVYLDAKTDEFLLGYEQSEAPSLMR